MRKTIMPDGIIRDEWERWQQGNCGTYAYTLATARPNLKPVATGTKETDDITDGWMLGHFYVTDGTYGYDSAGRHPMPYLGVERQFDYWEITDFEYEGIPDSEAGPEGPAVNISAALAHAERNGILDLIDQEMNRIK